MSCVAGSRIARVNLMVWRCGRVQSCVRPVAAVHMIAGLDGMQDIRIEACRHAAGCKPSRTKEVRIMIRILIGLMIGIVLEMYVAVSYPHAAKSVISRIH